MKIESLKISLHDYFTKEEHFDKEKELVIYNNEKRAMERIWKERDKQLEKVLLNTNHFIGSVKGIAGTSMPELKQIGAEDNLLEEEE
jgi:hypothetical protein